MATIKYSIRGKGTAAPIHLRLSISRGNTPRRKTGLHINSNDWSVKTGVPKQNNPENKNLKSKLEGLRNYILDRYNIDYSEGIFINGDWLTSQINTFFDQSKDETDLNRLSNYIEDYISKAHLKGNSKGNIGLSSSRINDYKRLKSLIKEFEGSTPIFIKNIDLAFKDKFLTWMSAKKNYSNGYAGRMLGNLKTICLDAEVKGIETNIQLKKVSGFKVKNKYVIYLSPKELELIKNAELAHDYLKNARKWLLLGCAIGQRGNDILNLTEENFVIRNGLKVIEMEQQKTGKHVTIPVLPETEYILKSGFPRKISLQRFNDYIKEVCKLSELTEKVKGKKLDPKSNRHKEGEFEKWELVTSHICRRSFATNQYGILPTPLIMQITAHSNEKTFYGYIGKNSFDYAQQIADFYAKQAIKEKNEPQLNIVGKVVNQ